MDGLILEIYHTTVIPYTKHPEEAVRQYLGISAIDYSIFPQCITASSESIYDFIYNQASQLWGNKMPLCGQHVAIEPSSVSPMSLAVIFLPPSMEPIHH